MERVNKRNSSIELLKLLSIFIIVVSHCTPQYKFEESIELAGYMNLHYASEGVQNFLLHIVHYFGQQGNAIFVVCSAWFLLNTKEGVLKSKKIWVIIKDTFIFSIIWLIMLLILGYDISKIDILKSFFPIAFSNNWFVGSYIIMYLLHPIFNRFIYSITQEKLLKINVGMILVYSCGVTLIGESIYNYSDIVGFALIYFIVAYFKLYMTNFNKNIKKNKKILFACILVMMTLILGTNYLGLHVSLFAHQVGHWNRYNNPVMMLIAILLFNIFNGFALHSKIINSLASNTLMIYIIHENFLFQKTLKPVIWENIYNNFSYRYILLWVLLYAIICFVFSEIISLIYREISKVILNIRFLTKVEKTTHKWIEIAWIKIRDRVYKLN